MIGNPARGAAPFGPLHNSPALYFPTAFTSDSGHASTARALSAIAAALSNHTLDERLRESVTFLREFARDPTKVGAIAPSSPGLVAAMVDWFDWDSVRNVVEFGPGTGVFTEAILQRLHPEANFFAIERSPEMVQLCRRRCPTATVFEESATRLGELCDQVGMDQVDAVICGLPWASFPVALQQEIIDAMLARMAPKGRFATFAYWQGVVLPAGRQFSKRLRTSFADVQRSHTVWKNLPPAFVYRCVK